MTGEVMVESWYDAFGAVVVSKRIFFLLCPILLNCPIVLLPTNVRSVCWISSNERVLTSASFGNACVFFLQLEDNRFDFYVYLSVLTRKIWNIHWNYRKNIRHHPRVEKP